MHPLLPIPIAIIIVGIIFWSLGFIRDWLILRKRLKIVKGQIISEIDPYGEENWNI